jgi:hypothetical protein
MVDVYSQTWAAVRDAATARIEKARGLALAPGVDERTADFERGRVAALQEILDLAKARSMAL